MFLERFPIRIRHIYVIRQPRFFSIVWAVAKLFFKKKLTERVHLLGDDLTALHAAVPAGVLPPEFGGTLVEASGCPCPWTVRGWTACLGLALWVALAPPEGLRL